MTPGEERVEALAVNLVAETAAYFSRSAYGAYWY